MAAAVERSPLPVFHGLCAIFRVCFQAVIQGIGHRRLPAGICTLNMTGMAQERCTIHSLDEMRCFGRTLGRLARPGDVICLDGDLGAGKTTLTQQVARGLEVPNECYVTSPSFAIMHEYPGGRLPLYHMDFYRLHGSGEVVDLGFDEYFYLSGITVIEWAKRAEEFLPKTRLHLFLHIGEGEGREIGCRCFGEGWRERLYQTFAECGLDWSEESGAEDE